ncbi:hypothetical protein LOD99_2082 [Oopsacas minuta]|uniref:carnosine N-methyltransferase n=1 Tax=Oopsacas minuta TaxID=111878 RepID=A0AAV7K475_9METZ|nr:hypothetical protein LOD99_2082 [Oopsacas minuta]
MSNYNEQLDRNNSHSTIDLEASRELKSKHRKDEERQNYTQPSPKFNSSVSELSDGPSGNFQMTSDEYEEERMHVFKVMTALKNYPNHMSMMINRVDRNFLKLTPEHRQMLPDFSDRLHRLKAAIKTNTDFINTILSSCDQVFVNSDVANRSDLDLANASINDKTLQPSLTKMDIDKVITTLKQFYRDWSKEGQKERDLCYKPILDSIQSYYSNSTLRSSIKILVPGCGLARLAFELAREGYTCQGNEFSMYMLLASNFILNSGSDVYQHTIYPWVHSQLNCWSVEDQFTPVRIPDVCPDSLPKPGNFSMTAGDFLIVYKDDNNQWDCVTTCYFIDTAHNIIEYIECINRILKPGGLWINFGPLLYHFAEICNEFSIELTYADIIKIMTKDLKFELLEERNIPSTYIENPNSMLTYQYHCAFFVARKTIL